MIAVTPELIYEQSKFWIALISFLWAIFKGFNWVKDIREKDLKDIHNGVTSLRGEIQGQTTQIVDQIKELRSDFRTFYTIPQPQMIPARAKAPRRKSTKTKPKSPARIELKLDRN